MEVSFCVLGAATKRLRDCNVEGTHVSWQLMMGMQVVLELALNANAQMTISHLRLVDEGAAISGHVY